MFNCHKDIIAYHNEGVTLPQNERAEMRKRRDTNRTRLESGLSRNGYPAPNMFRSQGSYAHRTMIQHPNKDYDIDDGIYFLKESLKGPKGGDKSAREAKEMVCKALQHQRFNRKPEIRTNCVRVYYNEGYHVDIPVYRIISEGDMYGTAVISYELASSDWKPSNPESVNAWFDKRNKSLSPDTTNGRQLRRIVRMLKAFARSRDSWQSKIATGFMITTLIADECYHHDIGREDKALYNTMVAMRDRLYDSLEINHPTINGEKLTKGKYDARARFLRDKLDWAINELGILHNNDCDSEKALKAWGKIFNTDFFTSRLQKRPLEIKSASNSYILRELNPPHRKKAPWPEDIKGHVAIEATMAKKGFRTKRFSSNSTPLPKRAELLFTAITNVYEPYEVYWQIVNTGQEAQYANCLRGGFEQGTLTKKESTLYKGKHSIECFIVKDGYLVARSGQFIVNIM